MNVDDLLAEDAFDRPRRRALEVWRTGDLVRGARLFWAGPAAADPVVGIDGGAGDDACWQVRTLPAEQGQWAVVTSQTCDVVGAGPGGRAPTVQVSPVWRANPADPGWVREVELRKHTDFFVLDAHPDGGPWIADLRMSMPLSKGALLTATRVHGFATDKRAVEFAEHVSLKQGRPALHDDLTGLLVPSLRTLLETPQAADWKYGIEQVRLLITDGTRLEPIRVQLLIVLDDATTLRRPLNGWRAKVAKTLAKREAGIRLVPSRWAELSKLDVVAYRGSVPLRLPELDRGEFR